MAKIRSGILGNTRGKVSGVVASQWKDRNYIREYVKPANPNTVAQQAQRSKMSLAVAFVRPIIGTILNVYMDKFYKSMSAYNGFIRDNIAKFTGTIDYTLMSITSGKLFSPAITSVSDGGDDQSIVIEFDTGLGSNGANDDGVMAGVYDINTGSWKLASEEVNRSTGTITVNLGYSDVGGSFAVYIFAVQRISGVISIVSDSSSSLFEV